MFLIGLPLSARSADALFASGFEALTPGSLLLGSETPPDGSLLPADAIPVVSARFEPMAGGQAAIVLRVDGVDVSGQTQFLADELHYTPAAALPEGPHQVEVVIGSGPAAVTSRWTFETATAPEIRAQAPYFALIAPGDPVVVRALYSDIGAGIDVAAVRLLEDQVEVTAAATVGVEAIEYVRASPYAEGEHDLQLTVVDLAGNPTVSAWSFTVGVAPELFDPLPESNQLLPFGSTAPILVHYRSNGSALDPDSLHFYLDATEVSGQATIAASDPEQGTIALQPASALAPGPHDVYVEVANATAVFGFAEWSFQVDDERLYQLTIQSPDEQAVVFDPTVAVVVAVQSNRDFPRDVLVNGARARFQSQTDDLALYTATVALQPGVNTLTASASFQDGSSRSASRQVTFEAPPEVSILSPADFTTLGPALPASPGERAIAVTGTVSRAVQRVTVNQQPATLTADGLGFGLDPYLLHEGDNLLSVVATDLFGRISSASVVVYVDQTAPLLTIESPAPDTVTSSARIDVRGIVNDAIGVGAVEPLVEIVNAANPQTTAAGVSDRSFLAEDVPLAVGANALTVRASDAQGNQSTRTLNVVRIAAGTRRITVLGGSRQSGPARSELAEPLRVAAIDAEGNPLADLPLRFDIVRGNGSISPQSGQASLADGVDPARNLVVATDAAGQAQVWLRLGSQASPGGNSVRVWHPDIAEDVIFSATVARGPAHFVLAEGRASTQYAATGGPPLEALIATVYDQNYNRAMGARVRYRVFAGDARFTAPSAPGAELAADGQSLIVTADRLGGVSARPWLGDQPGTVKILAEALREDGSVTGQAMFQLIVLTNRSGPTRFAGVVMDHTGQPLAGVMVSIGHTGLSTSTDGEGKFQFADQVPPGRIDLFIDGRAVVATPGLAYPALHFETTVIAGQDNQLPRPIYLPPVHLDRRQTVGGDQDVHFTLPGFEGFEMIVKAHSVTFPDGSPSGEISVNPVHNDRLPMVPPGGGSRFGSLAWTIQPSGTRFDPPIQIKLPNPGGMGPGETATLVQWDHDLATFVPIGRATVSEDASQIIADPGSGISKAGWGGCTGPACPPDPGFPQCAIGRPSQCRGAQCSSCNACQKESAAGAGSCPVCVPMVEADLDIEITAPPPTGQTAVQVSTNSEEATDVLFHMDTTGGENTNKEWQYESAVNTHVRDANVHGTHTEAKDLNCSVAFSPRMLSSDADDHDAVRSEFEMFATGSTTELTNDLITDPKATLKVSSCGLPGTEKTKMLNIKLENPTITTLNSFIDTVASAPYRHTIKQLACHESSRRQFKADGTPLLALNLDGGIGLLQVTDDAQLNCKTLWNWRENIRVGWLIYQEKIRAAGRTRSSEANDFNHATYLRNVDLRACLEANYGVGQEETAWRDLIARGRVVDLSQDQLVREAIRRNNGGRNYKYVGFAAQGVPANQLCGNGHWEEIPRRIGGDPDYVNRVLNCGVER